MKNTSVTNSIYILLAILAGVALTTQIGINSQLRLSLNSFLSASLISLAVATIVLIIAVVATNQPFLNATNIGQIAWYEYLGGFLGAFYVTVVIAAAQKLGATKIAVLIIAGQLVSALIYDNFGLLGFQLNPANLTRIIGAVLLIIGAYLVNLK
ncbi:MAG: DMT family transporter [Pyrinomonadaceae bacterium]|nr:DMT family transporter [Pyrinomonadaceae bacterium]